MDVMVDRLPVGPYRTVDIGSGLSAPFYIIPFDKDGVCTGPATRDHLLTAVGGGEYTDVFLFSHGWNNDWAAATGRYEDFLAGYLTLARDPNLAHQREVRPLLVGVFWPSTALVLPSEREPDIAAADPAATDAAVARERDEVRELASAVAPADRERFYDLAQRDGLADADALE